MVGKQEALEFLPVFPRSGRSTLSTGIAPRFPAVRPPDHSVFDPKDAPEHLINEESPFEIAHHLRGGR